MKKRISNLELLRIVSMFLIVLHHCSLFAFPNIDWAGSFNKTVVDWLSLGGKLGVNCFILISGYFMAHSKFTLQKFLKLAGSVWFYSVAIMLVFVLLSHSSGNILSIIQNFFPIIYKRYWFISAYVVLMLLSPFLNFFMHRTDRIMHRNLILLLTVMWSIMKTLIASDLAYNTLGWFIMLYLIAGYIRLYGNSLHNSKKHFLVAGMFTLLLMASVLTFNILGNKFHIQAFLAYSTYFAHDYSFILLIIAIELFIGFLTTTPFTNSGINTLASATLGVYLIHANGYLSPFIWTSIFHFEKVFHSPFLFLYELGAASIVYIVCTAIDLCRQYTIEKIYLICINSFLTKKEASCRSAICNIAHSIKKLLIRFYR